jgi:hypothetical protein
MGDVTDIADHRPHAAIFTPDGNAHVIPLSLLQNIADGKASIDDVADRDQVIRTIVAEWLRIIHGPT